jgi:FkbM family methyltransferase
VTHRRKATGIAILIVLLGTGITLKFSPRARIITLVLAGRSPQCTLRQALNSYEYEEWRLKGGRPKHLQMVRQEADGSQLWEIDSKQVWVPQTGERWVNAAPVTRYRVLDTTGEVLVHPGDVVLDCGGYNGDSAQEALDLGAKRVVSIEPSPRNLVCLRKNLEKEIADRRVIVVEKGVWDRDDVLILEEPADNAASDHIRDVRPTSLTPGGVKVPLTTIDELVEELHLDKVDFIKMDIEGAEYRALEGARKTIAQFHPRLAIAAYHLPGDNEEIPKLVRGIWPGYRLDCGRCLAEGWRIRPDFYYFH